MIFSPSLDWLIHPISVDNFLDKIWATKYHHFKRKDKKYFIDLFCESKVEKYLDTARPLESGVRVIRADGEIPRDKFRLPDGLLDLVAIRNAFADGYSIVLNGVGQNVPTISSLMHTIEIDLNFETQANAYITPPRSQAFKPHCDNHDVLVLQIDGSKTWRLYPDIEVTPYELAQQEAFNETELGEPTLLYVEAGEALYVPRGMVHAAVTNEDPSIHLTIGIHPPTVASLIARAAESLSLRDARAVERLPPRFLSNRDTRPQLDYLVGNLIDLLKEPDVIDDGIGSLQDALVRRGRCHATGHFVSNPLKVASINEDTLLSRYQPLYSRVLATSDGIALQFGQSLLHAPRGYRAAMLYLSSAKAPFLVRDIPELAAEDQIALARKLVVDGFMIFHPSAKRGVD